MTAAARKPMSLDDIGRAKRRAIQIVAQLPEDGVEAELVLKYARQLVRGFLAKPRAPHLRRVV
jgi:hypothetical protein